MEPTVNVEIPEKAEIEREWAEWQTGLAEQKAYAEIDPRPDKEDEDDHDDDRRLRDPSFIGSIVRGGGDDPKRCVITRMRRSH